MCEKHTSHAKPIETRVNKQDGTQIMQTQTWLSWMMWLRPKIRANIAPPDGSAGNGVLEMVRNAENGSSFFFLAFAPKTLCRSVLQMKHQQLEILRHWFGHPDPVMTVLKQLFPRTFPRFKKKTQNKNPQTILEARRRTREKHWNSWCILYLEHIAPSLLSDVPFNSTTFFFSEEDSGGLRRFVYKRMTLVYKKITLTFFLIFTFHPGLHTNMINYPPKRFSSPRDKIFKTVTTLLSADKTLEPPRCHITHIHPSSIPASSGSRGSCWCLSQLS